MFCQFLLETASNTQQFGIMSVMMPDAGADVVLFLYSSFWAALWQHDLDTAGRVLATLCTAAKIEDGKVRMRGHRHDVLNHALLGLARRTRRLQAAACRSTR